VKNPKQRFQDKTVLEAAQKLLNMRMKSPEENHWSIKMKTCTKERAQLIENMILNNRNFEANIFVGYVCS